ncbi:MAG: hypothetical protein MUE85_12915 [Microscillaceae bacterium]|nr:hypothetical protein [Microscillaceae bacterium]
MKSIVGMGLIILLGVLSAFQPDKTKVLTRKWLLAEFVTPRLERNFQQRGITSDRRNLVMQKLVKGSYVHFWADGTYETSILGSEPERLLWKLSENDSTLFVQKNAQIAPKTIDIEELTRQKLIMIIPDQDGEFTRMIFVPED